MYVDSNRIRLGANRSREASEWVAESARRLGSGSLAADSFGDFAAARAAHATVARVCRRHLVRAQRRHVGLTEIGDRADRTAAAFDDAEARNHELLRRLCR